MTLETPYNWAIPSLGKDPTEIRTQVQQRAWAVIFMMVLLVSAPNGKWSRCPSTVTTSQQGIMRHLTRMNWAMWVAWASIRNPTYGCKINTRTLWFQLCRASDSAGGLWCRRSALGSPGGGECGDRKWTLGGRVAAGASVSVVMTVPWSGWG